MSFIEIVPDLMKVASGSPVFTGIIVVLGLVIGFFLRKKMNKEKEIRMYKKSEEENTASASETRSEASGDRDSVNNRLDSYRKD